MAINTTSTLSNSVRTRYLEEYVKGVMPARLYDQFALPVPGNMAELQKGTSVQVNYLSKLAPATGTISQTQDMTPVTFRDATASISPTSRGNAIQDSELALLQTYTDYGATRFQYLGENMMESVDLLAQAAALKGTNIRRAVARASLDAGTTAHLLSDTSMSAAASHLMRLKCPWFVPDSAIGFNQPNWFALMHPDAYHDLVLGGNIVNIGIYSRPEMLLNHEVGRIGSFTILADPRAKVFMSAGAANASAVATTIDADANALAKTISVAAATNIAAGGWLTIGTLETGDTHYETNEKVQVASVSGTDITIIGSAENGGLVFDHSSGATVSNADDVIPVVYGGAESMAKLYAQNYIGEAGTEQSVGDYGTIVGPKVTGMANQFVSLAWKYYGNYGRWSESWILRGEYSSSVQA